MKKIKPEVTGYEVLDKYGDPCPIAYPTGSLKNSSENIIRMNLKNLIQTNGKPKYRPIYKKEIKHESTD